MVSNMIYFFVNNDQRSVENNIQPFLIQACIQLNSFQLKNFHQSSTMFSWIELNFCHGNEKDSLIEDEDDKWGWGQRDYLWCGGSWVIYFHRDNQWTSSNIISLKFWWRWEKSKDFSYLPTFHLPLLILIVLSYLSVYQTKMIIYSSWR